MEGHDLNIETLLGERARFRTASGLYLVLDADPREQLSRAEQQWMLSAAGVAFPLRAPPTMLDQTAVFVDMAALDLPDASVDAVRDLLQPLSYAPAVVWAARLLARLWPVRGDASAQLQLARELFGDAPVVANFERFLNDAQGGERRYLFSEQQLHVLIRLALESADGPPEDKTWNEEYESRARQGLFAVTSVIGEGASAVRDSGSTLEDWLGFFAQNGAYNQSAQPLLAYQRTWRIYMELTTSEAARAHPDFCPLDDWTQEHYGARLKELHAVGFAAMALTMKLNRPPDELAIVPPLERYLNDTALAGQHAAFTDALSADRDFYVNGFARSRTDPVRLAWEVTPFQQRPLMRLPDGPLVLTSPRALESWLTEGVHYRLLDIAASEGCRDAFTAFVGWLFEQYVLELFETALSEGRSEARAVHGEQPYAGMKTSDVAVDFGEDLVLCEVVSVRLPLGVRAEADEQELKRYIQRSVIDKLKQLDRVVSDVMDERASIPGVEVADVRRVWPVLVTVGEVMQGEPLWALLNREATGLFSESVCQPLVLLSIEDAEVMLGMVAAGGDMVSLLDEKTSGDYRELSWARWINDTREGDPPRLPELSKRWLDLSDESIELLGVRRGRE